MKRWWKLVLPKKAKLTEAERSFSDRMRLLRDALCDSDLCPHADYCSCFVMDVFDTYMVYSTGYGGEAYRVEYSIADDGTVTLGTNPVEVLPTMTYPDAPAEPEDDMMAEAFRTDCVPLREAALSEAATADLKLIQPGWGSSGYYSKDTLRSAAKHFTKGLQMFWNHQTAAEEAARPEGDLDHLAAELIEDSAYRENGPAGPGLYARARVFDRFAGAVKDLKDSIGVSIRAYGKAEAGEAEGRKGPVIKEITAAKSVDFVTVPGAGGRILQLFESAGRVPVQVSEREENQMTEEQIRALVESGIAPIRAENAALRQDNARLREAMAIGTASEFARKRLNTISLPQITRDRLVESLSGNPPLKDGVLDTAAFTAQIDEAAKREAEYLQAIGGGVVRGVGVREAAAIDPAKSQADMVAGFRALGLSEAGAIAAAEGRAA